MTSDACDYTENLQYVKFIKKKKIQVIGTNI